MPQIKTQSLQLTGAAAGNLLRTSVDLASPPALASTVDPQNGNGAATAGDAVDMREWGWVMFFLSLGVIDAVVDFRLEESDASAGSYTAISGKAITQLLGTADNQQAVITCKLSDLGTGKYYVKPVVEVGSGTSSLVAIIGLGFGQNQPEGVQLGDLASMVQAVPASSALINVARFCTAMPNLSPDMVIGDFTFAALGSTGIPLAELSGPVRLPSGRYGLKQQVQAVAESDPTQEEIVGVVIVRPGGAGTVLAAERFAQSVGIAREGDYVSYDLTIPLAVRQCA